MDFPQKNRFGLLALFLAMGFNGPSTAGQGQSSGSLDDGLPAPGHELTIGTGTFRAVVKSGEPGHAWVRALAGKRSFSDSIDLVVHHPVAHPGLDDVSPQDAILVHGHHSKDLGIPEGPEPIGSGRPDMERSTGTTCTNIRMGTGQATADIEYRWEWQNRDDTDGDGDPDANPGWVLVGVEVTILPTAVAVAC